MLCYDIINPVKIFVVIHTIYAITSSHIMELDTRIDG